MPSDCTANRQGPPTLEIGYEGDPVLPPGPRGDETWRLITGYPDDSRRPLTPDNELWSVFAFAWRWQDTWLSTPSGTKQHEDFWLAHLHMWPAKRGGRPNREALALALFEADRRNVPRQQMIEALHMDIDDLRDRDVLSLAARMRSDWDRGVSMVAPRVLTDDEYESRDRPVLLFDINLPLNPGPMRTVGDISLDVRLLANNLLEQVE
jgi:hypothetical protein